MAYLYSMISDNTVVITTGINPITISVQRATLLGDWESFIDDISVSDNTTYDVVYSQDGV